MRERHSGTRLNGEILIVTQIICLLFFPEDFSNIDFFHFFFEVEAQSFTVVTDITYDFSKVLEHLDFQLYKSFDLHKN